MSFRFFLTAWFVALALLVAGAVYNSAHAHPSVEHSHTHTGGE